MGPARQRPWVGSNVVLVNGHVVDLVSPVVRVGTTLGGEGDPEAVRELGLPSFESGPVIPASVVNEEVTRGAEPARKREADPEGRPFVLSETLPIVPAKLVKKILKGEFVDMAELLKDNMEAERRRCSTEAESMQGHIGQSSGRREVPDLMSWLQCFSSYAAVVCSKYPEKAREMWAYQATMISEFRRCGGRGWRLYDSAFRQHATSLETTDFSRINQGLYTTTFLAYGGKGQFCQSCMMSDHNHEECALHPSRTVPVVRIRESSSGGAREEVRLPRVPERKRVARGACFAWNDGRCTVPYCRFGHVCSRCASPDHRRPLCRARAAESDLNKGRDETQLRR